MKTPIAAMFLSAMALFVASNTPATAQNRGGAQVQTTDNGLGPPSQTQGRPARNSSQSGPFHNICRAENGINCPVSSTRRILDDEICHCGPYHGAILGTSQ